MVCLYPLDESFFSSNPSSAAIPSCISFVHHCTQNHGRVWFIESTEVGEIRVLVEGIKDIVGHVACAITSTDDSTSFRQYFHEIGSSSFILGCRETRCHYRKIVCMDLAVYSPYQQKAIVVSIPSPFFIR